MPFASRQNASSKSPTVETQVWRPERSDCNPSDSEEKSRSLNCRMRSLSRSSGAVTKQPSPSPSKAPAMAITTMRMAPTVRAWFSCCWERPRSSVTSSRASFREPSAGRSKAPAGRDATTSHRVRSSSSIERVPTCWHPLVGTPLLAGLHCPKPSLLKVKSCSCCTKAVAFQAPNLANTARAASRTTVWAASSANTRMLMGYASEVPRSKPISSGKASATCWTTKTLEFSFPM
mmetsp:Transcript_23280/g.73254  ORF Transcript_23280/g.73254 Transcript_23280/m.73254 type:complete len:233 (-) Transcript_23280:43-741(-)